MRFYFFLLFLIFCTLPTIGQTPVIDEANGKEELASRGISEQEFRKRMLEKGYDMDNIQPEQLSDLESVIEETLNELEKKTGETDDSGAKLIETVTPEEAIEDIKEAVADDSSLEEAVSEEIIEVVKEDLPPTTIYGQQIFRNQSLDVYRNAKDIRPPSNYILGFGDEIIIAIFGRSQAEFSFTINEEGFIKPTGISRIYLKGLTLEKATVLLQKRFSQYYSFSPEQFALTLNTARTVTVNIVGEVENSGSFTISAINTAFNALVAAGGPTGIGTVRKIKVIQGAEVKILDVYDFLFKPSVQYDFYLQNNDIIQVPVSEKIVAIDGAIKRPFSYELIEGEKLKDLIKYAGGLTVDASLENLQVTRIVNGQKMIIDVNLNQIINTSSDFSLQNGDVVNVRAVPGRLEDFVSIEGDVEFSGKYEATQNMRVSDLLKRGNLKEGARTDIAFLVRQNVDGTAQLIKLNLDEILQNPQGTSDILLIRKDKLIIQSQRSYLDQYSVSIAGAVRRAGTFDLNENLSLADLVYLSNGLTADATDFAYIVRTDLNNSDNIKYIKVNIKEAVLNPNSAANQLLQPFDEVKIISKTDFSDKYSVSISGAIRNPGNFSLGEDLTLADVVNLSNGLTTDATDFAYIIRTNLDNSDNIEYIRANIKEATLNPESEANLSLQPLDRIKIMSKTEFSDEFFVKVEGAVRTPGSYQFDKSLLLSDVLTMAGGLEISAASNRIDIFRVVINENEPTQTVVATVEVDENLNVKLADQISLEPFDIVVVRRVPDFELQQTVTLSGEVVYPGTYALISDNEKLLDVIKRAGGLTREAFPEGAQMYRTANNEGIVLLQLEKSMKKPSGRFNYILKNGDAISIPKNKDLVAITLRSTMANELYPDRFTQEGKINVAYVSGKRAKWYVDEYAGGVAREKKARKRYITVEYPNGEFKRSRGFGFLRGTPKVKKGSMVKVGVKPTKPPKPPKEEREKIDWNNIITSTMALAASVLTVITLATRL